MAKNMSIVERLHKRNVKIWKMTEETHSEMGDFMDFSKLYKMQRICKNIKTNKDFGQLSPSYTNCQVVKILSFGRFLKVDGRVVRGYEDLSSASLFEIQSYGKSIVRIWDQKSEKYLRITRRGDVGLTKHKDEDTLFRKTFEENDKDTFASHKYYLHKKHDLFLSTNHNGKVMPECGRCSSLARGRCTKDFQILQQTDIDCKPKRRRRR